MVSVAVAAAMGLVVTQSVSGAEQAQAFCTTGIGRWAVDQNTPHFSNSIPAAWNASVTAAISRWNAIPGSTLHYNPPRFNSTLATPGFQIASLSLRGIGLPDVPGLADGSQVQNHTRVTIVMSSDFSWNTSGIMDQATRRTDVVTILVHESGHASGLAHPGACGAGHPTAAERASVMWVDWTTKPFPNSEDQAGIAERY